MDLHMKMTRTSTLRNQLLSGLFLVLIAGPAWGQVAHDTPTKGSIAIQAVQGTPEGPAIGNVEVEVDLLYQNTVIETLSARLDEHGIVVIDNLPMNRDVQPVVRIAYAGVTYQEIGEIMGAAHRQQTVKVTCYEVTYEVPSWTIPIRQVMLSYVPEGLKVTEILVVMNPDEMTWLGTQQADARPVTMSLVLPDGAEQVSLGTGFHGWCCTSYEHGVLVSHLPMMPQMSEMSLSYVIPVETGSFELKISSPADIVQLVVMLPDQLHTHRVDGLALGGTKQIADTQVRYYTASDLAKGDSVSLAMSGIRHVQTQAVSEGTTSEPEARDSVMLVGLIGGGMFLLAGCAVVLRVKFNPSDQRGA